MFENVLGQGAASQIILDIKASALAPAMLFLGPPASGKGTAALELGRIISCEEENAEHRAAWNCACPSCLRHRLLLHPDLLCLGWRAFSAEIAASAGSFLRETAAKEASRLLFIRSVRKLLCRFNPALWEDDPKSSKISPLVYSLEEDLDEFEQSEIGGKNSAEKSVNAILKGAFKLESEGIAETIPIAQLRRAAWWSRLAPSGRGKLLIIENADRMQEEGRNSLLKLLEEPPVRLSIVLTTSRPGSLLPTIHSRVRPYRFGARDSATEDEVIRRVFRDNVKGLRIGDYLDSFLPVSRETLSALAAFFASSAAYKAVLLAKRQGSPQPVQAVLLGKHCAPKAEEAGLGKPQSDTYAVISLVLEKAGKFEIRSLFTRFLRCLLDEVSLSQREVSSDHFPGGQTAFYELWMNSIAWAENAVGVYNLRPAQGMEKIFTDLSRGMAELSQGRQNLPGGLK